ncbi:SMI1/KNR4 family protein [Streptomyces sp. NPDC051098]|uniref:SMI1/KNR4 family protein n=1 Tax=Streptomyces sp. NPDC051098 TaxID=3155411 RepID=UPI00341F0A93
MWRELILDLAADADLGGPVDDVSLTTVERVLGQRLPTDLIALFRECNGVALDGVDVVWGAEQVARDNTAFRGAPDFADLYMPFEPLMFFGDNAGGDQFAFVRTPERDDVFVWEHETDSRFMVAGGLLQYLEQALRQSGEDWYR